MDVFAMASGPIDVFTMSSGLTSPDQEISSPFTASPIPAARKRRNSSRASTPTHSRKPSSSPPPIVERMVHRRVEPAVDTFPDRLKQLEDQAEVDREHIDKLATVLYEAVDKANAHDLSIAKWRRWNDTVQGDIIRGQKDVLLKLDGAKNFILNKHDEELKKTRQEILNAGRF